MSLALSVLVLFFLALPGFLFLAAFRGKFVRAADAPVVDLGQIDAGLLWAFVFAPIAHACWIPVCSLFSTVSVNYECLTYLIAGEFEKDGAIANISAGVFGHGWHVIAYFASLYAASIAAGGLIHHLLITRMKLDAKMTALRFDNEWHYLLSDPSVREEAQAVRATVTVRTGNEVILYTGILDSYSVNSSGNLQYLVLAEPVFRRPLSSDRSNPSDADPATSSRFYKIEGDRFIVWDRDITSLNVDFFYLVEDSNGDSTVQ